MNQPNSQLKYKEALARFIKFVPDSANVVEINPSHPIYTELFLKNGYRVINIIRENEMVLENHRAYEVIKKNIENVLIPYKSIGGIWAHHTMTGSAKKQVQTRLSLFFDWLLKDGVIYFCLLEGDGYKYITEQSAVGFKKKLIVYYNPQDIQEILENLGFFVEDAWREVNKEQSWIHVIARKI